MRDYRLYLFDLDGTLYRGDSALPEAVEALARLRKRGVSVGFLTNNSSQSVLTVTEKLRRLGYEADPADVVTSATATAAYLQEHNIRHVQCLGEAGLVETLRDAGIGAVGPDQPWTSGAEAVIVGIFRQLTYAHLKEAMSTIRGGARFVATNADATYPVENDGLIPGAGSIVAAVRTCSEQEPFIVGKPSPFMTRLAIDRVGVSAGDCLVIGDRVDTDIESGKAAGCDTLLVLTGVTRRAPAGQSWVATLADLPG